LKILFFVNKSISSATARFRGYQISKELKKTYTTKVIRIDEIYNRYYVDKKRIKNFFNYLRIIKNTKKNDVLYLVKTVYNIDFLILIIFSKLLYNKKIVFDFDDAIYLKPFLKSSTKLLTHFSDAVVVGSNTLLKWAKIRNKNCFKIPTSVPHLIYKKKRLRKNKIFTIGWIGNGTNHYKNLKILKNVFEKLIEKKIIFKFKLIGLADNKDILRLFNSMKKLNFTYKNHIDWKNFKSSVNEIKKFDVGIMPLVNDEKTRGKCSFKIIEYMAAGVPVIASPVGENTIVIKNNVNGMLATSQNEWINKIIFLKKNNRLKKKMVKNALINVEKSYSNISCSEKLQIILKKIF